MNIPGHSDVSGIIPAGVRVEHLSGDSASPEAEILHLLKAALGGDDTPPWPANQRWLLWLSDRLLAHVSVQRRWFVVNTRYFEGWHVGGVCVHPASQRTGVGTFLMRRAHADLSTQELAFAVLNCGPQLVGFYKKVGYTKVSDRALFIRRGELVNEDDPAMAISFRQDFDVTVLTCDAFPFGFDF